MSVSKRTVRFSLLVPGLFALAPSGVAMLGRPDRSKVPTAPVTIEIRNRRDSSGVWFSLLLKMDSRICFCPAILPLGRSIGLIIYDVVVSAHFLRRPLSSRPHRH